MEKVKCAVIGAGIFGEIHCQAYSAYGKSELSVVCDLNEKRGRKMARLYGARYVKDYKEIAREKDINIVSVATPDFAHKDPAVAMLKAGKNVLVEKPMATKSGDAEKIAEAARKSGVKLMTDFHNRFNPPFVITKERLENNELGDIVSMYASMGDKLSVPLKWFKWSGESGPHWFLFPHLIDLLCWFRGSFPVSVFARGVKNVLKKKGVDCYDAVSAVLDFGDSYAVVETSWIIPEQWTTLIEFRVGLQTTSGKVNIMAEDQGVKIASDKKKYLDIPFFTGNSYVHGQNFGFIQPPIRHFVDCVVNDTPPLISPGEGVKNVKIIEAVEKSVKTGKKEDIKY